MPQTSTESHLPPVRNPAIHAAAKMLFAAALSTLAILPVAAQSSPDLIANPVESGQASEILTNKSYENSTPSIRDANRAADLHHTDGNPLPENSEVPKGFALVDSADGKGAASDHNRATTGDTLPPVMMSTGGKLNKNGTYAWVGIDVGLLVGKTEYDGYKQKPKMVSTKVADAANGPMIQKLRNGMNGLPITNSQFAILAGSAPQLAADKLLDPKGWKYAYRQMHQTQQAQGSDSQALAAEASGDAAFQSMMLNLVNVANETAAVPTQSNAPFKTHSEVIWMVQQMYKQCYLPMALLLLLPGAILTQVKGYVSHGLLGTQDDDSANPFSGIIRALIAVFLIPATQLVVSYSIDIGNSLTAAVRTHIDLKSVTSWAHEQTFNTSPANNQNFIDTNRPDTGANDPSRGKIADGSEKTATFEQQSYTTTTLQGIMNTIANYLSQGLAILNCFQVVLISYLFLLGPIAAALYAWPSHSTGSGNALFKRTFSSWLDGVVVLVLWKFWWCIVLLCMTVRLQQNAVNPHDQFEVFVYMAFMAILMFVPFQPFDFKPGEIVGRVLDKAAHAGGGKGGGGTTNGGGRVASKSSGGSGAGSATESSDGGGGASGADHDSGGTAPGSESGQQSGSAGGQQATVNSFHQTSAWSGSRPAGSGAAKNQSRQQPAGAPLAAPPPSERGKAGSRFRQTSTNLPPLSKNGQSGNSNTNQSKRDA